MVTVESDKAQCALTSHSCPIPVEESWGGLGQQSFLHGCSALLSLLAKEHEHTRSPVQGLILPPEGS